MPFVRLAADHHGGQAEFVERYDEEQLMALVTLIAFMSTANRLNVLLEQPAGGYRPGPFT